MKPKPLQVDAAPLNPETVEVETLNPKPLQVDAVPMAPGPDNPYGNGFTAVETDLLTTSSAQRLAAPDKARIWKIKNPDKTNPMSGGPVAYKLMPMGAGGAGGGGQGGEGGEGRVGLGRGGEKGRGGGGEGREGGRGGR
jgi:hypothetical protein